MKDSFSRMGLLKYALGIQYIGWMDSYESNLVLEFGKKDLQSD